MPVRLTTVLCIALLLQVSAVGAANRIGAIENEVQSIREQARSLEKKYFSQDGFKGANYVEERLIDGENYYQMKDYQRAAIIFFDIIETYPNHPAYPDALFYYSDALFLSGDYYGARNWFNKFLDKGEQSGFSRFRPKVVSRLVEIAIHIDDYTGVEKHLAALSGIGDAESNYVRAKYLYFRGDHDAALQIFNTISGSATVELKAAYFAAVILIKQTRYEEAIALLKREVDQHADGERQTLDLIDLLNLAIGRIYYEMDFVENAAAAYEKIGRYSSYYDVALYEAAAAQMSSGNTIGAERILEVLILSMPDSKYIPRAKLLRGNLLLQAGRYEDAEQVFQQTIDEFEPVYQSVADTIAQTDEAGGFFNLLTERSLGSLNAEGVMPQEIIKWVGEDRQVQRAFDLTEDLSEAIQYTAEAERLVRLIGAVVDGSSPVNAIPTLQSAKRQSIILRNRVGLLTNSLMILMEKQYDANAKLQTLSKQRRAFIKKMSQLPADHEAFQKREEEAKAVFVAMRKELSRQQIVLDKLVAMVVALSRFVKKTEYIESVDAEALKGFKAELDRHRLGVQVKRESLKRLKEDVEKATYQIGIGDERDVADQQLVDNLEELLPAYTAAISGDNASGYKSVASTLESTSKLVRKLNTAIDVKAAREVAELRRTLARERDKVRRYKTELGAIGEEADEVVDGVARSNFSGIRKKFHDLLLKADVGIIDIAWMRKEEHKSRGVQLNKDRAKEIKNLDQQFGDVE